MTPVTCLAMDGYLESVPIGHHAASDDNRMVP
ncbi:hypothetical protein STPYR_12820 [uncultured Stenotrophomonas sp.]|uniref:Uncharacterized protein n=1 Tax=uncultured Stenotrophomonas sp. TaxID=165438 RepID=A0A1Y5QBP3_9GAMM|nr:hypothetical protein STPYR_12820 [uncultured Stenotrophomonas sp.]